MTQSQRRTCMTWIAIAVCGLSPFAACAQQHAPEPSGPAPVLMTVRERLKPGEEATHAKLEAEYADVLDAGKGSEYYLGMGAITGYDETMFLSGYASLEEMSDVHDYDETMMGAKLDSLEKLHNSTLAGTETNIWRLRPDLSSPIVGSLGKMRYMQMIQIHVKLGHGAEFTTVLKQVQQGWMKVDPDFHYSVYQENYGQAPDDSYLVIIPVKSLADLDMHHAKLATYHKQIGEDAYKHMLEFESSDYNSTVSNLFVFTPGMSRLPDSWTKDDQAFWNPKPVSAAPMKKPATEKK